MFNLWRYGAATVARRGRLGRFASLILFSEQRPTTDFCQGKQHMTTLIRDYDATAFMQPACGFDSLSGDVKGTAVVGTPGQPIGGREAVFSLYKVESAEDFVKSLNIDASVSLQVEYSGPPKVDHSGHLHLLRLFPSQPPCIPARWTSPGVR